MKPFYQNLCTEFYDLTKPKPCPKEVSFYETLVKTANGPVLEAMSGSGRLLIPLIKRGLKIEGVDNSIHMLKSCEERSKSLDVTLYNQSLQSLSLPKKYDIIFIAMGSFQLIFDRMEAFNVLKNLHSALLPQGRLVIETFVPWDAIKDNIENSKINDQSQEKVFQSLAISENSKIILKSTVMVDFKEQLTKSKSLYEKWINGIFSHQEEEEYIVRWYHRYEMELLLQQVGYSSVNIEDTSFEHNEQAVVYTATR